MSHIIYQCKSDKSLSSKTIQNTNNELQKHTNEKKDVLALETKNVEWWMLREYFGWGSENWGTVSKERGTILTFAPG